jgi:hypothetical protein
LGSRVFHNFDDGLDGFKERFFRYGVGNRKIAKSYGLDLTPQRFKPKVDNKLKSFYAEIQYEYLTLGYNSDTTMHNDGENTSGKKGYQLS